MRCRPTILTHGADDVVRSARSARRGHLGRCPDLCDGEARLAGPGRQLTGGPHRSGRIHQPKLAIRSDVGSSAPVPAVVPGRDLRCGPQPEPRLVTSRSCRRPATAGPEQVGVASASTTLASRPSAVAMSSRLAGSQVRPRARQDARSPTERQSGDADSWNDPAASAVPAPTTASYTSMSRVPAPTVAVPPTTCTRDSRLTSSTRPVPEDQPPYVALLNAARRCVGSPANSTARCVGGRGAVGDHLSGWIESNRGLNSSRPARSRTRPAARGDPPSLPCNVCNCGAFGVPADVAGDARRRLNLAYRAPRLDVCWPDAVQPVSVAAVLTAASRLSTSRRRSVHHLTRSSRESRTQTAVSPRSATLAEAASAA